VTCGLRDYGIPPVVWGGDSACEHVWASHIQPAADGSLTLNGNSAMRAGHQGNKSHTMKATESAVCVKCGRRATLTQRLLNGEPAPLGGPEIQVGGAKAYEARCRTCWGR